MHKTGAGGGNRTRTVTILSRLPLPLGYTGTTASGQTRPSLLASLPGVNRQVPSVQKSRLRHLLRFCPAILYRDPVRSDPLCG